MAFTFTKEERLCNKAVIAKLFDKGNRGFTQFPFRFIWVDAHFDSPYPVQVLFAVSKRNFPRAVQRNRIKRQMRELYRLQKAQLYSSLEKSGKEIALMISFTGKQVLTSGEMQAQFRTGLLRLKTEIEKGPPIPIHRPDQAL